tara:strand:+ start:111 stop:758 length:648 start_codon:yes stop_codon:yes gene_type:complete
MKVLFCGYRDWALKIYYSLCKEYELELVSTPKALHESLSKNSFDVLFFIGWSWLIPDNIINNNSCVCLHPSPLPKYRGGSPIQNQIINGEKTSAVTLFEMDKGIDTGPILYQKMFSLEGDLNSIFNDIQLIGTEGIKTFLEGGCTAEPQDHDLATFFKRRTPEMSEINLNDFQRFTAEEVFNKVRCLQHPYPLAYIKCKGGTKLYLKEVLLDDDR